jgi:hypothetical protein
MLAGAGFNKRCKQRRRSSCVYRVGVISLNHHGQVCGMQLPGKSNTDNNNNNNNDSKVTKINIYLFASSCPEKMVSGCCRKSKTTSVRMVSSRARAGAYGNL